MGTHVHCNNNLSAFSALHLLRSYNHLLTPQASSLSHPYHQLLMAPRVPSFPQTTSPGVPPPFSHLSSTAYIAPHGILGNYQPYPTILPLSTQDKLSSPSIRKDPIQSGGPLNAKRQRGEKKPIPEELKDERYFERRKRNNRAAKKSRDARKIREDQIAIHATMLERENTIMRAQILTLREEVSSLRHMVMKNTEKDEVRPEDAVLEPLGSKST